MKRTTLLTMGAVFALALTSTAQQQPYFTAHPTLSPDGKTIVFSYEGDLWKSPVSGGHAHRITALPGEEKNPRISPDGKWLAFSSNQFGNYDLFVMPLEGGDIRQLTHHDAQDDLDSWSWDSRTLYFTSGRHNRFTSYQVDVNGGTARRVFPHYFNTIHQVVAMPEGNLLFNDSWESYSAANRKGYKGAFNPDILSYDPKTTSFKQLTDYEGKDFWQTVDRSGKIYFVSDEGNGEYNLYTMDHDGQKKALTSFETAVKRPAVSANGEKVVFEKDYQIFIYDVATSQSNLVPLTMNRNPVLAKEQEFDIKERISAFDVSPDGKKLAFISRGEVFVSDVDGKFIRQIHPNGERAMEIKWLKDNKTLILGRTLNGYPNWQAISADGSGSIRQLTAEARSNRNLVLDADRKQGIYLSGRDQVRILDLSSLESRTIVQDEIWAFQNSSPSFSPDGKWALFTAIRNFEQDIFVHHLADGKTMNLTNTGVTEASPAWSPDGKSIFFASNRTKPSYPFGMQDARIYQMNLDNFDQPYRSEKFDELFAEEEKNNKKSMEPIRINTENMRDRISPIGPSFGSQASPFVFDRNQKTYVFYGSNHEGGRRGTYRTIIQDFENSKTEKVTDGSAGGMVEADGKFYALIGGAIQKYNLESNKLEKIDLTHKFQRNLNAEFNQMFYETWAGLEENFYESDFHGVDWAGIRDLYSRFLPYLNNRNDLRTLLADMLGELNSSHLGFNSSGQEERKNLHAVTNETGIIFEEQNPYRVKRIANNSQAGRIGRDIQPGDILVAVDGADVNTQEDRDAYFTKPSLQQEMQLTFQRNGQLVHTTVRPQSSAALRDNLYGEWIKQNRKRTDSLSGDRIAYSHMKNMSGGELEVFLLDMVEQENNKEGIILDLRYNTGGNVHDEVLKFLSQRPYLQWQYRGGKRAPQSNFGPAGKPIVLLINQQSLSDAEMTAAGFKALGLGTIIGTETYRWIIFTSSKGLVDGSNYRVPGWGTYTLEGDNLERTGVAPDIYVKNSFQDLIQDKDPQLERAVQEILKQL